MNMRRLSLALVSLTLLWGTSMSAQTSYDLRSPDNRIELRVRTAPQVTYDVILNGRALLEGSTLSLDVDHKKLAINPKVTGAKKRSNDEMVEPVVRQKFAKIRDRYNELKLSMDGGYAVTFRVYNEGVAYRLETSLPDKEVKVYGEEANFNFPSDFVVYLPQHLTQIEPQFIATLPAVVDVGQGVKVAIAESDLESYPGLWLRGTAPHFGLAATFPPYPLKMIQTSDRDYKVTESADYIAVTSGTRTYPWRVIGIAEHDGDLITNQLAWLLERPAQ